MTDLIKQAEALEVRAIEHEASAKNLTVAAEKCRAEAAKLREQAREPRRCWTGWYEVPHKVCCSYETKAELENCRVNGCAPIYGCEMVEVRPVRITPEHEQQAWQIFNDTYGFGAKPWRAVMEYALSLAGVEVEK